MNKNKSVRFAACVAFALAESATLPAAELTHRWSFNGDYSDSVGGADAVVVRHADAPIAVPAGATYLDATGLSDAGMVRIEREVEAACREIDKIYK